MAIEINGTRANAIHVSIIDPIITQGPGNNPAYVMSQKAINDYVYNPLKAVEAKIPAIDRNAARISNLESRLADDIFIKASTEIPANVAPYAAIDKIGGRTHLNGKTFIHAGAQLIQSLDANGVVVDTFELPANLNLDGWGVGTLAANNHIRYDDSGKVYYSRPVKVYEFSGDEDLGEYGSTDAFFRCVSASLDDAEHYPDNPLCSHLEYGEHANTFFISSGSSRFSFRLPYDFFTNGEATNGERIAAIRQWLKDERAKGTPVTIVYPLETPPADIDITDLVPADNYIKVESGGSIATVNDYDLDAPVEITCQRRA